MQVQARHLRDRMRSLNKAALLSFATLTAPRQALPAAAAAAAAAPSPAATGDDHPLAAFLQPIQPPSASHSSNWDPLTGTPLPQTTTSSLQAGPMSHAASPSLQAVSALPTAGAAAQANGHHAASKAQIAPEADAAELANGHSQPQPLPHAPQPDSSGLSHQTGLHPAGSTTAVVSAADESSSRGHANGFASAERA